MTQLCMEVIAYSLDPSQIENLRKQFLKIDVNKAGEISLEDLSRVMGNVVTQDGQIERVFEGINYSQSGMINYHEFLAATISRSALKEENMKLAFEMISNHNDYFTGEDISALLGSQKSEQDVSTYLLTCLLIYLLVCLLTCLLACLLTYLFAYLFACSLTYLFAYLFAYLLTYLFACLLTCLLTYLFACLLTCLLAYLSSSIPVCTVIITFCIGQILVVDKSCVCVFVCSFVCLFGCV